MSLRLLLFHLQTFATFEVKNLKMKKLRKEMTDIILNTRKNMKVKKIPFWQKQSNKLKHLFLEKAELINTEEIKIKKQKKLISFLTEAVFIFFVCWFIYHKNKFDEKDKNKFSVPSCTSCIEIKLKDFLRQSKKDLKCSTINSSQKIFCFKKFVFISSSKSVCLFISCFFSCFFFSNSDEHDER